MQPNENLTLDDFPTLRHALDFLAGADFKKNLTPDPLEDIGHSPPSSDAGTVHWAKTSGATPVSKSTNGAAATVAEPLARAVQSDLALLRLSGTPYQMGFEHGRQKRDEIRALCAGTPILPGLTSTI